MRTCTILLSLCFSLLLELPANSSPLITINPFLPLPAQTPVIIPSTLDAVNKQKHCHRHLFRENSEECKF